jgi:anti-sigma regulatory factor (Ser/Thr protein kinase)
MRLPDSAQAPATARAFLRGAACSTHRAQVFDEAELLVSELTTNAVLHGRPPITVRVDCHASEGLRVSVTDGNPQPQIPQEPNHDDATGRGIALVDVISDRWGVHPRPGEGKEVWFQLRSPRRSAGPAAPAS